MTLPNFTLAFGPRDYGVRKGTAGVILHTTEPSSHVTTLSAALATARWQASSSTGSYNFIVASDGIALTVPIDHSAGGVNPASSAWAPDAFLKTSLPAGAYADPNAWHVQISLQGRVDGFAKSGYPQQMVDWGADLIQLVDKTFGIRSVISGHLNWQTNRTDPGQRYIDLVKSALTTSLPDTSIGGDDLNLVSPVTAYQRGTATFTAGKTYSFFKPTGDPDPNKWTDRRTFTPPSNTRAHVDGPFAFSGFSGSRWRVLDGTFAGYFISSGEMPTIVVDPPEPVDCTEAIQQALVPLQAKIENARKALA